MDARATSAPANAATWPGWLTALSGWKKILFLFAAGGFSALAFAPVFFSPVLFLTLPVLVWAIDSSRNTKSAAAAGWWFGFGYFFFNLFWVGEAFLVEAEKFAWLLPFAVTLLPAGLALFWSGAAALSKSGWAPGFARVLLLAITLAVAEWLRGHLFTGFPWNTLGYALTYPLPLMQSAGLFGTYGLTPIAVVVFAGPAVLLADAGRWRARDILSAISVAVVPILILLAYGAWRLSAPQDLVEGVKLRIVQPSVPQREKWRPEYQRQIFDDHLRMSAENEAGQNDGLSGITHVVWPEAAMPFFPLDYPQALEMIGSMLPPGKFLITGALRHEPDPSGQSPTPLGKVFNSLIVFDHEAKVVALYDKITLVPFGEYVPFDEVLSQIGITKLTHGRGSFSTGITPRPLIAVPGLPPALGLICYEALFPGQIVSGSVRPSVLLNVTNDGWFGNMTGPYQHFHQARVRAVEEGVPLVRAANNGISAVIDPYGRDIKSLGLNVKGTIDSALPSAISPPPYARVGNLALLGIILLYAAVYGFVRLRRR